MGACTWTVDTVREWAVEVGGLPKDQAARMPICGRDLVTLSVDGLRQALTAAELLPECIEGFISCVDMLRDAPAALPAATAPRNPKIPNPFRAFVVGVNDYLHGPRLRVCVNDARSVATLLDRKGYDVDLLEDCTLAVFCERFARFARSLAPSSIAVLYFAGHGVQVSGVNHFLFADQAESDACSASSRLQFK
jgi:hypothetical protein